jgi:hypothetical protein
MTWPKWPEAGGAPAENGLLQAAKWTYLGRPMPS